MTTIEQEAIEAACKALDKAFNTGTLTYDPASVMNAHRILKALDLAPRKRPAKARTQP